MDNIQKVNRLNEMVMKLYTNNKLEFHGWKHVNFVRKKAKLFAESINANVFLVESAALVHDFNYIEKVNSNPQEGKKLREKILSECKYTKKEIELIENIIIEENTSSRNENISIEAKALSDADTLFKALPITPILLTGKYIQENKISIKQLADKITSEQNKLFDKGIYFYTDSAKKYLSWAKTNLDLWNNVLVALEDEDVKEVL